MSEDAAGLYVSARTLAPRYEAGLCLISAATSDNKQGLSMVQKTNIIYAETHSFFAAYAQHPSLKLPGRAETPPTLGHQNAFFGNLRSYEAWSHIFQVQTSNSPSCDDYLYHLWVIAHSVYLICVAILRYLMSARK